MKKVFSNEKGLTLTELLAVLSVGAIFMLIIVNVHLLIQERYVDQSEDADGLFNVTLAGKEIINEIRKNPEYIKIIDNKTIIFNEGHPNAETSYQLVGDTLQKDGYDYIRDIKKFEISLICEGENNNKCDKDAEDKPTAGDKISIVIGSKVNPAKKIDTEIIIR